MKNKIIVITGASQGLGKTLSLRLANLGAKVIMLARTESLLSELKNEITNGGGTAEYFVCDVTLLDQVTVTFSKISGKYGNIDILINNAGLWTNNKLDSSHIDRILEVFKVNSIAPVYVTNQVLPVFEKQKYGHLVYINSISGLDIPENKDWPTYSASKWALSGYVKALTAKYAGTDIKVTSIHPGPIDSKMPANAGDDWGNDKSWLMTTDEVADAIIYAISAPGKIQIGTIELKKTNWNQ
ncbi:SDR family oxidoreductase [Candidatus Shapirobacteria bacterium]|nr:SDR family oxidoreductase [Candidatus Shapirobacteria bacterium]